MLRAGTALPIRKVLYSILLFCREVTNFARGVPHGRVMLEGARPRCVPTGCHPERRN